MLLGPNKIPLDGLEPGGKPNGVRVPDLPSASASPVAPGARGVEPAVGADHASVASGRGACGGVARASVRVLHTAGAHGVDAQLGRQGPATGSVEGPPPAPRRAARLGQARPTLSGSSLTSESQHVVPACLTSWSRVS